MSQYFSILTYFSFWGKFGSHVVNMKKYKAERFLSTFNTQKTESNSQEALHFP